MFCLPALALSPLNAGAYPNVTISDVSGKPQTNVPVTFGHAFPKGTQFTGLVLANGGALYPTQVDVKRKWPDGSIKHAVLSTVIPSLGANQSMTLAMNDNAAATGAPVTVSAANAPDVTLQFTIAGTVPIAKSVSLKDLIAATPSPKYWLQGPVVGEAIYEGAPKAAGVPDSSLNVQFHVRYFPAAKMSRVSVIVDNDWKLHRSNIKYAVKVLTGSKLLFEDDTVTHYFSARWKKDFYIGVDGFQEPMIAHDLSYLISTGLIARYATNIPANQAFIASEWTRFANTENRQIMGNGPITPYFPQTGGREDIGLLPGWTARYLTSMDPRAKAICLGAADLSGSFSVHVRDTNGDRIVSVEKYPTATLLDASAQYSAAADKIPVGVGASPYTVDVAHQASFVYVPYIVTGDMYYLEELYHWANYDILEKNFDYRGRGQGLMYADQVRGQAWGLRTIADAAAIAPDDHPEKGYFDRVMNNNAVYFDSAIVNQCPAGNWGNQSNIASDGGRPDDGMDPSVRYYTSPWQNDFLALAFDHIMDLGYTNYKPARDQLLKQSVGRVTNAPGYNPFDGAPYHVATEDVSGAKYTDWTTIWKKTFAKRTDPVPTALSEGDCAHGYPYILRAALSAAVRDNLPGGSAAWSFVEAHLTRACFADIQSWALVPNAGDKTTLGKSASIKAPGADAFKKKLQDLRVSVAPRSGAVVLSAEGLDADARWIVSDLSGKILAQATGAECALPQAFTGGVRMYRLHTAFGDLSGLVPALRD